MSKINKQSGFTLIELLVVISIIGLLSSVVLVALSSAKLKAQDSKIISQRHEIVNALELYYTSHGGYPYINSGGVLADQLYCIGGTDCVINNVPIATMLPAGTLEIGTINTPSITTSNAVNKGFIYQTCTKDTPLLEVCPPSANITDTHQGQYDYNTTIPHAGRVLSATNSNGVVEQQVGIWSLKSPRSIPLVGGGT